jgi:hypothetical protein
MNSVCRTISLAAIWAATAYIVANIPMTDFRLMVMMMCGVTVSVCVATHNGHCCAESGCFEEEEEEEEAR